MEHAEHFPGGYTARMIYELLAQGQQAVTSQSVVWFGVASIPLIVGIVQIAKQSGLPTRFTGLAALVTGLAGGVLSARFGIDADVPAAIASGIMAGLAAAGAWSMSAPLRSQDPGD